MEYNPNNTAVVVVDMQKDFCEEGGALYAEMSEEHVQPTVELVDRARDVEVPVVFTKDVHPNQQFEDAHYYDEFERWGEHVVEGSVGAELVEPLQNRANTEDDDICVVEKHTYDAFYQTRLEGWLTAHGVDNLLIAGTLANVCVLHTAGSAGLRDFRPVLVEDAIGAISAADKEYAVDHADWLFGETTTLDSVAFKQH